MATVISTRPVEYTEGPQLDAFHRVRVSQPNLLLSATGVHDIRADLFDTETSGGGTVVATRGMITPRPRPREAPPLPPRGRTI